MPEYRKFSANFGGDEIAAKPLTRLKRLTDRSIYSLKKALVYCTLGVDGLRVWTVPANILNKHLTRDSPPTSCLGQGLTCVTAKIRVTKRYAVSRT
jgi:hypothetical protein